MIMIVTVVFLILIIIILISFKNQNNNNIVSYLQDIPDNIIVKRKEYEINPLLQQQQDNIVPNNIHDVQGTDLDPATNPLPSTETVQQIVQPQVEQKPVTVVFSDGSQNTLGQLPGGEQEQTTVNSQQSEKYSQFLINTVHKKPINTLDEEQNIPLNQKFNPQKLAEEMKRNKFL